MEGHVRKPADEIPAKETMMATTDDCPITDECPGYDRDGGVCLVRATDCAIASVATDFQPPVDGVADALLPGDSIVS